MKIEQKKIKEFREKFPVEPFYNGFQLSSNPNETELLMWQEKIRQNAEWVRDSFESFLLQTIKETREEEKYKIKEDLENILSRQEFYDEDFDNYIQALNN